MRLLKFLYFLAALTLSACVTVKVGPKEPVKSAGVEFATPKSQFIKLNDVAADAAWLNEKNGNVISFTSECNSEKESTLNELQLAAAKAFSENPTVIKTEAAIFDDRESSRSFYEGKVDGVLMAMDVLTFKKNSCDYIISLLGKRKSIELSAVDFSNFIKGFKAP